MSAASYFQHEIPAFIQAIGVVVLPGVVAFTAGVLGLTRISRSRGTKAGTGMAIAGVLCGLAALCFGLPLIFFEFLVFADVS